MRKKARSEIAKGRNAALIKSKFLIRMINVVGIALNAETSNIKVVCLHFVPQISCLFTIFFLFTFQCPSTNVRSVPWGIEVNEMIRHTFASKLKL